MCVGVWGVQGERKRTGVGSGMYDMGVRWNVAHSPSNKTLPPELLTV